jgi:hypothetical protein
MSVKSVIIAGVPLAVAIFAIGDYFIQMAKTFIEWRK